MQGSILTSTSSGSFSGASRSSASTGLIDDDDSRFYNSLSSSNRSCSMHASRVLWIAGINGGPDEDVHGLKIIFQQIVGPGDAIVALVLFDRITSELGISFGLSPGGFLTAGGRKQLDWLTGKLLFWRNKLKNMAAYCQEQNITLELRLCAGPSLGDIAVQEALHLQATDIILDRANGQGSTVRRMGRLLSEKTNAKVAIMHKWPWPWSGRVESSIQIRVDSILHENTFPMPTSDADKQAMIDEITKGFNCTCLEAQDPYYLLLLVVLAAASDTLTA